MTVAVASPRLGHLQDLIDAAREAADTGSVEARTYYAGFVLGFTASFCQDEVLTDLLTEARQHPFAATYDLPNAVARWGLLGEAAPTSGYNRHLRLCGVLYGWKQGTAERRDATECSLCESRILLDDDIHADCAHHGTFCDEECLRSICTRACHANDEVTVR